MPSSRSGKEGKNYGSEQYAKRVPTIPIREAVEKYLKETSTSYTKMAKDLGFIAPGKSKGDYTQLQRMLGVRSERQRNGTFSFRKTMQYDNAVKIIRYIGR